MSLSQASVTALATLFAVALGGWLTTRAQDRLWRRDQEREWRDIRLANYTSFLASFREYVAYVSLPAVRVTTVTRPRPPHDPMPFFDEEGARYKERLDAAKSALRLVTNAPEVIQASSAMVQHARWLAAERATHDVDTIPPQRFEDLWAAEARFVRAARDELGLASLTADGAQATWRVMDGNR